MNNYIPIPKDKPILIDACIFMVGIDKRPIDSNFSLAKMLDVWMSSIFSYFENILIHRIVYNELDNDTRVIIDANVGKNITIVDDNDLINNEPEYMRIFNQIHDHALMNDPFSRTKNQGEVHSLAYACYNNIPFFSTKDLVVDLVCNDIEDLSAITIVGFESILAIAYTSDIEDKNKRKALKSLYKEYCAPRIRQGAIPKTLAEFVGIE